MNIKSEHQAPPPTPTSLTLGERVTEMTFRCRRQPVSVSTLILTEFETNVALIFMQHNILLTIVKLPHLLLR